MYFRTKEKIFLCTSAKQFYVFHVTYSIISVMLQKCVERRIYVFPTFDILFISVKWNSMYFWTIPTFLCISYLTFSIHFLKQILYNSVYVFPILPKIKLRYSMYFRLCISYLQSMYFCLCISKVVNFTYFCLHIYCDPLRINEGKEENIWKLITDWNPYWHANWTQDSILTLGLCHTKRKFWA